MNMKRQICALAGALLVTSAWAQTTQPLNLKLPPGNNDAPASSSSAARPASSSSTTNPGSTAKPGSAAGSGSTAAAARPAPGVYYGDTSGSMGNSTADTQTCDDSRFNDAQVHGSVSTGVVSGSHVGTGVWQGGEVNVTKAFGDCDHPTGGIGFSIGVSQGSFHGGHGY